jgi:predicted GNAT family acetyltransferase
VVFDAGMRAPDELLLDNPMYAALCGPQERLAEVHGRARRYPADIAPFFALPSPPSAQDWRDAAALFAPGTYAAVWLADRDLPDTWQAVGSFELVQMIGERAFGAECPEAVPLAAEDVPEMLELVTRTEPGPFLSRTIELGDYLGLRQDGKLIAMAGERFHLDGWTEISAVCTSPEHRGRGLASRLMAALALEIEGRSERVFLHALTSNTGAIRLYQELGFRIRQTATITLVGPKPGTSSP